MHVLGRSHPLGSRHDRRQRWRRDRRGHFSDWRQALVIDTVAGYLQQNGWRMQLCSGGCGGRRRRFVSAKCIENRYFDRTLPVEHGRVGCPAREANRRVDGRSRRVVIAGHVILGAGRRRSGRRRYHDRRRQIDAGARGRKVFEHGQDGVRAGHLGADPPVTSQTEIMQS